MRLQIPDKMREFSNLNSHYRVRAAKGGRGGGKTYTAIEVLLAKAILMSNNGANGLFLLGRAFQNSLEDSLMKEISGVLNKRDDMRPYFNPNLKGTADGRISFSYVGLRVNAHSIKSKANVLLALVDEAEYVPDKAWDLLRPTVRGYQSEIWALWNPESPNSYVARNFVDVNDIHVLETTINWQDNPWFPQSLEIERQLCLKNMPHLYNWIWRGDFAPDVAGYYYMGAVKAARDEGRVGTFVKGQNAQLFAACDIGFSDETVMVVFWYWVDSEGNDFFLIEDCISNTRKQTEWYLEELQSNGYANAFLLLPHDAANRYANGAKSFAEKCSEMGFRVNISHKGGTDSYKYVINHTWAIFHNMLFNKASRVENMRTSDYRVEKLLKMLSEYKAAMSDTDSGETIIKKPEHGSASHYADAFGQIASNITTIKSLYKEKLITPIDQYRQTSFSMPTGGWSF